MNVKRADNVRKLISAVVLGIMIYALYVSRSHITHVGYAIELTPFEAETLFVLIDVPALVGKLLTGKLFAPSTQKSGRRLMWTTGALSLGCNITSGAIGGGVGPAVYGAFVVVMFVTLENVLGKIRPAAAVTKARRAVEPVAEVQPVRTTRARVARPAVAVAASTPRRTVKASV